MSEPATHVRMTIKAKLQLAFLLVAFLSVAVTGWQSFESARSAIEEITSDRLTSIRETKKRQIESYFRQIQDQAVTLSEDRMVTEAMARLTEAHSRLPAAARSRLRDLVVRDTVEASSPITAFRNIHRRYHPILEHYRRRFGYDDLFLVNVNGIVVYAAATKSDFGTDLLTGPERGTGLAAAFAEMRAATDADETRFVDFSAYGPSGNAPAAFMASPIMESGRLIGVLVFQIPIERINEVMTSANQWSAEGLGRTGETYIVGADLRMRTDSRFFIQEPEEYFRRLAKTGTDSATIAHIRSQHSSILLQTVRTDATIDALQGNTATKIIVDYRGLPVLSSYAPLRLPDVRWVILSEIDTSEAFDPVFRLRERFILVALAILLLAAAAGLVIARTISRPVHELTQTARQFGKGRSSVRAHIPSGDEIGLLADAFNTMADRITTNTARLHSLSAHLQTAREEERKALAREIHDELGQALTTLKLQLSILRRETHRAGHRAEESFQSMLDLIDTTIRSVKRIITELRPALLDGPGLAAAVEWQVEEFQNRTGIACSLTISPDAFILDPERSTALFRILQEALTNVSRHAKANHIVISLTEHPEDIELRVADDGVGITEQEVNDGRSFGLIGIRERASYWGGRAEVNGKQNEGTTVVVRIPQDRQEAR